MVDYDNAFALFKFAYCDKCNVVRVSKDMALLTNNDGLDNTYSNFVDALNLRSGYKYKLYNFIELKSVDIEELLYIGKDYILAVAHKRTPGATSLQISLDTVLNGIQRYVLLDNDFKEVSTVVGEFIFDGHIMYENLDRINNFKTWNKVVLNSKLEKIYTFKHEVKSIKTLEKYDNSNDERFSNVMELNVTNGNKETILYLVTYKAKENNRETQEILVFDTNKNSIVNIVKLENSLDRNISTGVYIDHVSLNIYKIV